MGESLTSEKALLSPRGRHAFPLRFRRGRLALSFSRLEKMRVLMKVYKPCIELIWT